MQPMVIDDTEVQRLSRKLAVTRRELDACRDNLQRQLELAARVHRSLLPHPVRDERIHIDIRYIPIEQVGGDYCQVRFSDRDTCFITTCDVTGHGIAPALLATRVSSEVRYGILYGRPPREIVRALNRFICDHFEEAELYLSFVVARIDLPRREITWCGAGHPSPLLIRRRSALQRLDSQNPLIGVAGKILSDPPEPTIKLEPGDRLLFYTDGLTEATGADGRQLGIEGLARIATEAADLDLFKTADWILDKVAQHNQGPILDDRTLIVAEMQ